MASESPYTVEKIIGGGGYQKTRGIRYKALYFNDFLAKGRNTKIDKQTRKADNGKFYKFFQQGFG